MHERASAIEKAFDVEVPARLQKFYEAKQAPKGQLELTDGFLRGTFQLSFDEDCLLDIETLCENYLIDEMTREQWTEEFSQYVPLATLADAEEDNVGVKSFLVVDVSSAKCPVSVWDYDGWYVYPLSATLDDFLAGKSNGKRAEGDHAGEPYKKFSWS
jgi:hypothetical protein